MGLTNKYLAYLARNVREFSKVNLIILTKNYEKNWSDEDNGERWKILDNTTHTVFHKNNTKIFYVFHSIRGI